MTGEPLNYDDREVLAAFLKAARTETADVLVHEIVANAHLPFPTVQASLTKLRALGYLTELRKYGPGRRLARVTTEAIR